MHACTLSIGTGDAEAVRRHDLGFVIEAAAAAAAAAELRGVTASDLERWRANLRKLPAAEYVHGERGPGELRQALAALAGRGR